MDIIDKLTKILFFVGIFFIPFNSFDGISFLGEYQNEAAAFFFIFGFFLIVLNGFNRAIAIPYRNPIFQVLLLFVAWCLICTLLNFHTVLQSYFKLTSGINRFIRQYISLILSSIILFIFYWNVILKMELKEILFKIRKVFLLSLIIAFIYGFLETLIIVFKIPSVSAIIGLFNYFPFLNVKVFGDRISSVSYEAPFLAIYLITIAGWMFSYIYTSKGIMKFAPMFMILFLTFFSGSRTGLFVVFIQLIAFLSILFYSKKYRKYALIFIGFVIVILTTLILANSKVVIEEFGKKIESFNIKENLTESVSNKSRIGIQYASFQVFKEHPVVGVGFGQQTYHNRFFYPVWATTNNYEFNLFYKNQFLKSFPPGYNLYLRILTETGIIGILIYFFILYLIFRQLLILIKNRKEEEKILAVVLFIGFLGITINSLQIDTFRIYGFWIFLAILIKMSSLRYLNKVESKNL